MRDSVVLSFQLFFNVIFINKYLVYINKQKPAIKSDVSVSSCRSNEKQRIQILRIDKGVCIPYFHLNLSMAS